MPAQDGGTTAPVDVLVIVSTDPEVTCAQLFERTGLRALPGRTAWLDEVPAGPARLVLTAGERAALLAVTITLAQGAPIVLSAEHPTGAPL